MANKVAVIDSEYITLKLKLGKIHTRFSREITSSIRELEAINASDNSFHAESLNNRITAIIAELDSVNTGIAAAFDASEDNIGKFQRVVNDYDAKL